MRKAKKKKKKKSQNERNKNFRFRLRRKSDVIVILMTTLQQQKTQLTFSAFGAEYRYFRSGETRQMDKYAAEKLRNGV